MRRKAPDYELYFENVGEPSPVRMEATLNLFLSYLQMLNEVSVQIEKLLLTDELKETYTNQIRELTQFQDFAEIGKMKISKDYLAQLKEATLKEAQKRRCQLCYFHSLLNIEALSEGEGELSKLELKFILLYKLSDSIKVYFDFLEFESLNNDNKNVMQKAYAVALLGSVGMTCYLFQRWIKKKEDQEKQLEKALNAGKEDKEPLD